MSLQDASAEQNEGKRSGGIRCPATTPAAAGSVGRALIPDQGECRRGEWLAIPCLIQVLQQHTRLAVWLTAQVAAASTAMHSAATRHGRWMSPLCVLQLFGGIRHIADGARS
eukprot:ctg_786.g165